MMLSICKKVLFCALFFYLGSTAYTRVRDCDFSGFLEKSLYALPIDAFPLKYMSTLFLVSTQIGVLSSSEVSELFKDNPDEFSHMNKGLKLNSLDFSGKDEDYLVLRFKNSNAASSGLLSLYLPCLQSGISNFIYLPGGMNDYVNIVLPYSPSLEKDLNDSSEVFARWKCFL